MFVNIFDLSQYYFNANFIPPFLVACLILILGLFVLSLEKRSALNRSFLYLCLSTALWLFSECFILNAKSVSLALVWSRFMYTGLIFVAPAIFHISIAYTERHDGEKWYVIAAYSLAFLFAVSLWSTNLITGMREYVWGSYPDAHLFLLFFLIFLLLCSLLGLSNLISYYLAATDRLVKKRTKHLIIVFIFAALSSIEILPSYGIAIYPLGYIPVLCFGLSITYSIIKYHNLMVERHAKELEIEVNQKTKDLSQALAQLKATQLKLLETGKISAMASLSAGILHQISQPITAIHGIVRFLKKEIGDDSPYSKPCKLVEEQSMYIKGMLEDLMELIRHREIRKENVEVNFCLKKATDLVTDELRIRRIHMQMTMGDNLPHVYADAIHLQQIFMNIMVNAMQALDTLPKGIERNLFINTRKNQDKQVVEVIFRNNGPALTKEEMQYMFEPFFSTKIKGTGIGLALCKDLIAEHHGEIDVQSELNKETIFTVRLPGLST